MSKEASLELKFLDLFYFIFHYFILTKTINF